VDPFAKVQGRGLQRIREAGIEVTVGVLEEECKQLNKFFFTYHQYHRPYILLKWAQTNNGFLDDDGKALAISSPYTKMLVHRLRSEYDAIVVGRITDEREHPLLNVREWSGPSPYRYVLSHDNGIDQILNECYERQQQSLIVEGGRQTLQSFLDRGLWDEIRIETAPFMVEKGTPAPLLPGDVSLVKEERYDSCIIRWYKDPS
jgi:diaminohydroxyphosphoribosylaminopyrimidine deaminase/5-amino-6-(5-phosphoribosylamino)uracil reductase